MTTGAQLTVLAPAPGILAMSGALVFATAAKALADARPAVARDEVTTLDLAGVTASDSAGLAVLLALRRAAQARGVTMAITSVPATLLALAQLGEVEDLLGIRA